jgi:hypothetical protein
MTSKATAFSRSDRTIATVAAFAIAALPLYFLTPRMIGMALGVQDPSGSSLEIQVASIAANPNLYASLGLLPLIVGASFFVLALALHEHFRAAAPLAMRVATAAGILGGTLFLLAGFGPMTTAKWISDDQAQDQATAIALYVTNQSVTDRQIATGTILFGTFMLIVSRVGARTGAFSRAFSYAGVLAGAVWFGALLIPPLWLVGLLMMIVWSAWLGVALMRGTKQGSSAPHMTALGQV